ncbi:hypothetical protein ALC57_16079 [Trachymyrmex cornetzi]|uniref:Uncharacterized protein n=1 Tax=Trachymyrmex cornetzi TaxID=471704 RepID=A0A151IVX6_9HYME|nr:hypothetical protein ALC57_16079 [Trachymyrmex cornetzi]
MEKIGSGRHPGVNKIRLMDCVQKYVLKLNKKNPKLILSCISKIILYIF